MERTLKSVAKEAKKRMKTGFWQEKKDELEAKKAFARARGENENEVERYFTQKIGSEVKGETADEFYLKVKTMLLEEGEVSDAIGRLTDRAYYESLGYEERQRYTLELSERYLSALKRFKREYEFELRHEKKN